MVIVDVRITYCTLFPDHIDPEWMGRLISTAVA